MHPSDPLYAQQWHFGAIGNIEKVWDEYSGAGVHVGIYDTGVESAHPDLAGNYDASRLVVINGVTLSGDVNPAGEPDPVSRGHGTAVAGIIGAALNGVGGVGVAWGSSLTSVNIFDSTTSIDIQTGNLADFAAAIGQMTKFDVTNNSWNTKPDYEAQANINGSTGWATVNATFAEVSANGRGGLGTVIVQGIGNDGLDAQGCGLNGSRFTITVAGAEQSGFAAGYSNYGACVLVTAATSSVLTGTGSFLTTTDLTGTDGYNLSPTGTGADDYTDRFGGTSAAGPMVTGVVALMLQANPGLGWRDVQNILAASATHTGSAIGALAPGTNENGTWFLDQAGDWNGGGRHFSNDYGYGMLNAYNAVRMAEAWSLFTPAQTTANEHFWSNSDNTAHPIADQSTLDVSVNLAPTPFTIDVEHVDVTLALTHADYTQLRIYLISPQGTEVQLYDGSGGTSATAAGGMTWTYGVDALRGENVAGTWTVRIDDTVAGGTGTLQGVTITAYGQGGSANDVYHYTDEFLAMATLPGQAARTTLADGNGGSDWIDAAAVTGAMALNLNAGTFTGVNGVNWFHIAPGTTIENAVTGDGNDRLTGNAVANRLYGMRGNDVLIGGTGNDTLAGGAGNDNLSGGTGNDMLVGGKGKDALSGGTGRDSFVFSAAAESVRGANRDTILAFKHSEHDVIDLAAIDANTGLAGNQAFRYIGVDSFAHYHALHHSVIGMIRFAGGIVQGNLNANMAPDFEIKVTGAPSLLATDFHL